MPRDALLLSPAHPIHSRTRPAAAAPGLAALEALLLFVLCGAALALLAGHIESLRTTMRKDLAARQLALLQEALHVYHLDQGSFPDGRGDLLAIDAWKTLRSTPSSARVLANWPAVAESTPDAEPLDPWRQTYRYLGLSNDRSQLVTDNGRWPIFVSSGPDGHFGNADPFAEIDNLATDSLLLNSQVP